MLATGNKGRQRGRKKHKIHLKNSPSLKAPQRLCNRKGLLSAFFSPVFPLGMSQRDDLLSNVFKVTRPILVSLLQQRQQRFSRHCRTYPLLMAP